MIFFGRNHLGFYVLSAILVSMLTAMLFWGCGEDNNEPPVIDALIVPYTITVGEDVAFQAIAHDPDGDALTYFWTVNGIPLEAVTQAVTWKATDIMGDIVMVKVSVSDGISIPATEERAANLERVELTIPEVEASAVLEAEIIAVLMELWKRGYETEDLELYMSAFWNEGYFYWSDMATDDVGDDVSFDQWEEERDSAIRVFQNYRNIEIEISDPPEVEILDESKTRAVVRNNYKIQLYVPEGTSLPGGYEALYAEGDNIFIFEFRRNSNGAEEWRITEWRQNEYTEEEIQATWDLHIDKLLAQWGAIKSR